VLAVVPTLLYWLNVFLYRPAPPPSAAPPPMSVLVPARNEEASIAAALAAVLASRGVEFEVVVLDDHSEDRTPAVVADIATRDSRVRLVTSDPLPDGWCGKQFACHQLASHARHQIFVFIDADVRLAPDALARLAAFLDASRADLVSGLPRQEAGTFLEKLVLPLIHFVLLSYLPLLVMRFSRRPAFGAGCGQLFVTRRTAYDAAGGHAAIRGSLHDGIKLPRAYRRAGLKTDLCDATDLAECRMYRSGRDLWRGLAKNAREGMAHPKAIVSWTVILFGGQVLPVVLLTCAAWIDRVPLNLAGLAAAAAYGVRFDLAWRFRQSWLGALLHPIGVTVLLAIQWYAAARAWAGRPVGWKGRGHPAVTARPG
jgi:glycosyltransferase involved in cell wall biosynthesis